MNDNKWISVKDKPYPSTKRPVLIYMPNACIPIRVDFYDRGYGEDDDEWFGGWAFFGDDEANEVTHWMELPEPPKEG